MSDPKPPMPPLPDTLSAISTRVPNDILGIQPRALADAAAQSAHQAAIEAARVAMKGDLSASGAVTSRTMGIEMTHYFPDAEGNMRMEVNSLNGPAPQPVTRAIVQPPNPTAPKGPKR